LNNRTCSRFIVLANVSFVLEPPLSTICEVKYEEVYLRAYDTVSEARTSIGTYLGFYNSGRPHSSLDRRTPDQAYFNRPPHAAAA
jgi:transposase InsO family protein